jgi:hypothetical protein
MNFMSIISLSNESKHLENTYKLLFRKDTSFPIIMGFIFCLGEQAPPPLFLLSTFYVLVSFLFNKLPFKGKKGQRNNIMGWERIKEVGGKEGIGDKRGK